MICQQRTNIDRECGSEYSEQRSLSVAMARSLWMTALVASLAVAAADVLGKLGSARLQLAPGGNATCPWLVSLLDGSGNNGGWEICTNELGFSFAVTGAVKEPATTTPAAASPFLDYSTEAPYPKWNSTAGPGSTTASTSGAAGRASVVPPVRYERLATGGFYKLHMRARTWHDARDTCESEGAHLLVIETLAEGAAIQDFLRSKNLASPQQPEFTLHAGFRLSLVTVRGELSTYRWRPALVQDFGEEIYRTCGQMDSDAWLRYGSCLSWNLFICEYRSATVPQTETTPHAVPSANSLTDCSPVRERFLSAKGYVLLLNGTYVKDLGHKRSWHGAESACESEGASMIVVESAEKAEALIDFMIEYRIENLYVGVKTGKPITELGKSPSADYNRWINKETDEPCFSTNKKLQLQEIRCSAQHNFRVVCQMNESEYT